MACTRVAADAEIERTVARGSLTHLTLFFTCVCVCVSAATFLKASIFSGATILRKHTRRRKCVSYSYTAISRCNSAMTFVPSHDNGVVCQTLF